jgi:long-subunit fatty acid transport protein
MSLNLGKYFFSYILLFSVATATAQTSDAGSSPLSNKQNSPYSRYGLGDLRSGANVAYRGMGFATTAIADGFAINTENPASYSAVTLTTYEAAGEGNSTQLKTNNQTIPTGMATLAYMNVAFPIGKHFGMAIGVKPASRIYYNVQDSTSEPGIGDAMRIYFGDGNLNKAFIGFSGEAYGVSLGFNFGYTFGNMRTTSAFINLDTTTAVNSEISRYTRIGGIYYNLGAMYEAKLNEKYRLNIGATASLSQKLHAERDEYWISYLGISGISSYDTILNSVNAKGSLILPLSYSFGAQLAATDKWRVAADFSGTQWSQFRNFGSKDDSLQASTFKIGVGGELTPDAKSIRKYFPRVTYRLGFYYGTDHIRLRNTDMNFYAFTLGASLPFKKSPDRIHTALEIGKRGTQANGLIQENFVKFSLGVSLNAFADRWFIKRKYE